MQEPTESPRDDLSVAQVVALIQDSPALTVGCGLDLIDLSLNVLEDVSADFIGGSVARNNLATLHGTADLAISRQLDWGQAIVRPWLSLSDGLITARFELGAYYTSVPEHSLEESPPTFAVQGFDILLGLADPVGESYSLEAGTLVLAAVEDILTQRGYTAYLIDQAAVAKMLPAARVWAMADNPTWLGIVNDLLAAGGYQGIWSDWHGRLRCQPYQTPSERAPEWTYDAHLLTSMLAPDRSVTADFFDAPNRWVFVWNATVDDAPPYEGNGIYTWTNETTGLTSVEARGGRVITRVEQVDAADQAALVARAQITIDADMRGQTTVSARTAPNPLHWHYDRLLINDPALGMPADVLVSSWSLPLDGGNMTHEWSVLPS